MEQTTRIRCIIRNPYRPLNGSVFNNVLIPIESPLKACSVVTYTRNSIPSEINIRIKNEDLVTSVGRRLISNTVGEKDPGSRGVNNEWVRRSTVSRRRVNGNSNICCAGCCAGIIIFGSLPFVKYCCENRQYYLTRYHSPNIAAKDDKHI